MITFSFRTFSYFRIAYGSMCVYNASMCMYMTLCCVFMYAYVCVCVCMCVYVCAVYVYVLCVNVRVLDSLHCNSCLMQAYCVLKYHFLCRIMILYIFYAISLTIYRIIGLRLSLFGTT